MGMSMHVYGFVPPDEKWRRMRAAYDACRAVGVDPPAEVEAFFRGAEPDPAGIEVPNLGAALREWQDCDGGDSEGYEVEIAKLPPDVKILRFVCSW